MSKVYTKETPMSPTHPSDCPRGTISSHCHGLGGILYANIHVTLSARQGLRRLKEDIEEARIHSNSNLNHRVLIYTYIHTSMNCSWAIHVYGNSTRAHTHTHTHIHTHTHSYYSY